MLKIASGLQSVVLLITDSIGLRLANKFDALFEKSDYGDE
jgi:hypothetical protein